MSTTPVHTIVKTIMLDPNNCQNNNCPPPPRSLSQKIHANIPPPPPPSTHTHTHTHMKIWLRYFVRLCRRKLHLQLKEKKFESGRSRRMSDQSVCHCVRGSLTKQLSMHSLLAVKPQDAMPRAKRSFFSGFLMR